MFTWLIRAEGEQVCLTQWDTRGGSLGRLGDMHASQHDTTQDLSQPDRVKDKQYCSQRWLSGFEIEHCPITWWQFPECSLRGPETKAVGIYLPLAQDSVLIWHPPGRAPGGRHPSLCVNLTVNSSRLSFTQAKEALHTTSASLLQ